MSWSDVDVSRTMRCDTDTSNANGADAGRIDGGGSGIGNGSSESFVLAIRARTSRPVPALPTGATDVCAPHLRNGPLNPRARASSTSSTAKLRGITWLGAKPPTCADPLSDAGLDGCDGSRRG